MKAQVVSFHCVLENALGKVLSTSFNRDVITQISANSPVEIAGFPAHLAAVSPGEHRRISLKAQEAYGLYDPALARQASRRSVAGPGSLAIGDQVHLADSFGDFRLYRVTGILGDLIYLDANHPLAGQDLVFDVHILEARDATEEEVRSSSHPAPTPYLQ